MVEIWGWGSLVVLLTAPVGFIRKSALNVKGVRAGQISRIVGISTEARGSTFRFKSKTKRFMPWAVRKVTSEVSLADTKLNIKYLQRTSPTPQIGLKNLLWSFVTRAVASWIGERADPMQSQVYSAFLIGWNWGLDIDMYIKRERVANRVPKRLWKGCHHYVPMLCTKFSRSLSFKRVWIRSKRFFQWLFDSEDFGVEAMLYDILAHFRNCCWSW